MGVGPRRENDSAMLLGIFDGISDVVPRIKHLCINAMCKYGDQKHSYTNSPCLPRTPHRSR